MRRAQLIDWLSQFHSTFMLEKASSDASFRSYERLTLAEGSWIAMDAPPGQENLARFIELAQAMHALRLPVPKIEQFDIDQGFALIEDFGGQTLADFLTTEEGRRSVDQVYKMAISQLISLQCKTTELRPLLEPYAEALLQDEMILLRDWLAIGLLDQAPPNPFDHWVTQLSAQALAQPQVFTHRDYHSRNLMKRSIGGLGIIDFQDAVLGPVSYDLVSLLRDCYVVWPEELVDQWLKYYWQHAKQESIVVGEDFDVFRQWFDTMGVQRHMKAAGIFARLYLRDGKSNYLNDIPRTLDYIVIHAARNPAYTSLAAWVRDSLKPGIEKYLASAAQVTTV